jgi:PHD/YefM family antitoxin component YafN of YafNO toxin-antitoxin module
MSNLSNIYAFSEFQESGKAFLVTLKETKAPIFLTVDDKAAIVVQDAESYLQLLDRIELLESIESINKSVKEFEQGEGLSLKKAFQEFQEKYGLPD